MRPIAKLYISIVFALSSIVSLHAQRMPFISYGIEWGGTVTFLSSHHFNFICSEGYRIDSEDQEASGQVNGVILAKIGINITDGLQISLYSGYAGIEHNRRIVPIEGRVNYYPKGLGCDGILTSAGAGIGINSSWTGITSSYARIGCGYHIALTGSTGLDFIISYRLCTDRPRIEDPDGGYVPERDIRKDIATYHALKLSIGLNF